MAIGRWGGRASPHVGKDISSAALTEQQRQRTPRKDLTPAERERLERSGSLEFKSAGATRKQAAEREQH